MPGCDCCVRQHSAIDRSDRHRGVLGVTEIDLAYPIGVGNYLGVAHRARCRCPPSSSVKPAQRLCWGKRHARQELQERAPFVAKIYPHVPDGDQISEIGGLGRLYVSTQKLIYHGPRVVIMPNGPCRQ